MARYTLIVAALALLLAAPAEAQRLYKWIDEQGNVTYLDHPPPEGAGRVEQKELHLRPGGEGGPAGDAAAKSPVTLYVTPNCASCDLARQHLKKRDIPFRELDVSESNLPAQQEMRSKVGQLVVPTVTVGAKVLRGYTDTLLDSELDQAGYPKPEAPPAEGEPAPAQP
jgi:glutaredoxin